MALNFHTTRCHTPEKGALPVLTVSINICILHTVYYTWKSNILLPGMGGKGHPVNSNNNKA